MRELLSAMKYQIVELDGSDGENTTELVSSVKRIRDVRVPQGHTAVLLDDYESLTEEASKRMATMLANATDSHLAPMIITCTQFKEPRLRVWKPFHDVRLYSPNEHVCRDWFDTNGFVLQTNRNGELQEVQCFPGHGWDVQEAAHLGAATCVVLRLLSSGESSPGTY